jgi:serine/threonine protein kinase
MEEAKSDVETAVLDQKWDALQSLEAFRTMVRAVQRIHSLRLVHRDIKPDNFLVTEAGVKLSDFGTARFLDGVEPSILTTYDRPPGDRRYTPPELFACLHDVEPDIALKADIYGLGAILFEMFTGVKLGLQLFEPNVLKQLTAHMTQIRRDQRIRIFNEIVDDIARANPLPQIASLNPVLRRSIRDRVDSLYKSMCDLNYLKRNCHFPSIFRQIDSCVLILKNEARYQAWQTERQRRRAIRLARRVTIHDYDSTRP